jgi:2,4-dienoyl-CoA reductase-like NADH-dependent reductase (Old Yellow Enzyme family)/thioredoxin reductase
MRFPHLFQEGAISGCVLRNRLIMSLYPTKYAVDSTVNERMTAFYRERARGGVSMIVLDCPCLDFPRAYKGPQELRIDTDEYASGVRRLVSTIQSEGAKAFMQLNYPKERVFDHEVAGAKQKGKKWVAPLARTMTTDEAEDILAIMAGGARRARDLGYDGVEVQASYGDLISQLLSPLSNGRSDKFGGSLDNRARFLVELVGLVKESAGRDFPVMVKLVCDEFVEGGLTLRETAVIGRMIADAGADAILASGGNKATKHMTIPSHYLGPGPLVHLARGMKNAVTIPVIAVGKIPSPEFAEQIIRDNDADFVAMARPLLADPFLPEKALGGDVDGIRGCVYDLEDCSEQGVRGLGRSCTVNPFAGQEYRLTITPAPVRKRVVVIGGGPAGMQATLIARSRGHHVTLFERGKALGGQMLLASGAPCKAEMAECLRHLGHEVTRSNAEVCLGKDPDIGEILNLRPEAVIIATGSNPLVPDIPGMTLPFVHDVRAVYDKHRTVESPVIIIGGGDIGCETADLLSEIGKEVTIIEMSEEIMRRMKDIPKQELLKRLHDKRVAILTSARVRSIEDGKVIIEDRGGSEKEVACRSVVVAVGSLPADSLASRLGESVRDVYVVGDAKEPGNLGAALRSATEVCLTI